ncbi:MAG: hypothetical protein ABJA78_05315 [Ferruginibacter sp.]
MKKSIKKKSTGYSQHPIVSKLHEPEISYRAIKSYPAVKVKDFTYSDFKKMADKVPFTQLQWAAILHVSERTLQRYAKSNASFAAINTQRALQIAHVIKKAREVFGDINNFYHWISRNPSTLEGNLSFESLTTHEGIEKVLTQMGRIEHGLFA